MDHQLQAFGVHSRMQIHFFALMWVKTMLKTMTQITIFIGGMFTIPSHGWFMTLFCPHYCNWDNLG